MATTQKTSATNQLAGRPIQIRFKRISYVPLISRRDTIARNQNTFAKRQREAEKKAKAQAKLNRRKQQKEEGDENNTLDLHSMDPRNFDPPTE